MNSFLPEGKDNAHQYKTEDKIFGTSNNRKSIYTQVESYQPFRK